MRAVVLSIWIVFAFMMIAFGSSGKNSQVFVNIHIYIPYRTRYCVSRFEHITCVFLTKVIHVHIVYIPISFADVNVDNEATRKIRCCN